LVRWDGVSYDRKQTGRASLMATLRSMNHRLGQRLPLDSCRSDGGGGELTERVNSLLFGHQDQTLGFFG